LQDTARGFPDFAELPRRCDRRTAAALLTKYFFQASHRTLERWPLSWRLLNGRAHCETAELFEVAESMLAQAPCIRGGQRIGPNDSLPCCNPVPPQERGRQKGPALASRHLRRSGKRRRHDPATEPEVLA
jgi:hypothetical protein